MSTHRPPRNSCALLAVLLSAGLLPACGVDQQEGGPPDAGEAVSEWEVAAEPSLSIGVVDGDERYQMHQVVGAVQLHDGRIAVMNAGSAELRIYAPDGTFISAHGRPGEGPGEFRTASRMHLIGDTIFIHDSRLQRLSVHDDAGSFLENRPLRPAAGRFQLDEWLYDRSWIDGPPFGVGRAPVMAAVPMLPAPDSAEMFRYVRVSPYGHLWVRQPREPDAPAVDWIVYDMAAEPIARVHLPAGFEVMDFGRDYLLGRVRDEFDVEYVQLLRLDAVNVPQQKMVFTPSPADTTREMVADSAFAPRAREMMGALRMLNNLQEIYYSTPENSYRYATHISQLTDFEVPEGIDMHIVVANERGWSAVAMDAASGRMCGIAIGLVTPTGWMPGVVSCQ
ncbi:MAG TPA: 6-bladed beta-propeller [Longimicrobiales bacterium]|nr:6-bladed beta-propeller [Longimicrobiales bacterium]